MIAGVPDLHELYRLGFGETMILGIVPNPAVFEVSIENRW
jgi:hypothetical protein